MDRVRFDRAKKPVSLLLDSEGPDVSQGLVLDYSVAFDAVNRHRAPIVNLGERAKGFIVSWGNNVHLVAISD